MRINRDALLAAPARQRSEVLKAFPRQSPVELRGVRSVDEKQGSKQFVLTSKVDNAMPDITIGDVGVNVSLNPDEKEKKKDVVEPNPCASRGTEAVSKSIPVTSKGAEKMIINEAELFEIPPTLMGKLDLFPKGCMVWYDAVVNGGGGSFTVRRGTVVSALMDTNRRVIYRIEEHDLTNKVLPTIAIVPEDLGKVTYAANCPVFITVADDDAAEVKGEIVCPQPSSSVRNTKYTVMTYKDDNKVEIEENVQRHRLRYRHIGVLQKMIGYCYQGNYGQ